MEVEVHHCLPSCTADVHPDIVPVRVMSPVCVCLCLKNEIEEGGTLLRGGIEERGDMPEGDGKQVPPGHGKPVRPHVGEIVLQEDIPVRGIAEGAARHGIRQLVSPGIHSLGVHPEKG